MRDIYVKGIVVLGLASSILSSQIPAIQWATVANNPFYYFIPSHYSEYRTEPQQNPTHENARDTQLTPVYRSIIGKIAILSLQGQILELKKEMKTLKSDWDAMKTDFEQKTQQLTKDVEDAKSSVATVKTSLEETNATLEATKTDLKGTKSELEETKINLATNIVNLDQTKTDLEKLIAKYTLKSDWDALKTDFEQKIQQLTKDMEDTKSSVTTVKTSLEETNVTLEATKTDLKDTKSDLGETKINLATNIANLDQTKTDLEKLIARYNADHSSSDDGTIPESCSDLQAAGHKNSGIYLIKGSSAIESTYCNFKNPKLDKLIGSVDVKSVPTYFYVQKDDFFFYIDLPIPFEVEKVNVGKAMNLTSGKFTAPRKGTYFFSFTCSGGFNPAASTLSTLTAGLYLNDSLVGVGTDEEMNTTFDTQHNQLTIEMTLNLEANDQVWIQFVEMSEVTLHDHQHSTHFTGFMLEENIVASL